MNTTTIKNIEQPMANSLRGGALARLSKTIALTIFLFCTLFTSAQYIADEDLFHYNCDETISIYLSTK
jgi:hypothetical protein